MKNEKVLAIIPARAGSKGIPGKNIKPIAGQPLINWTIRQALGSKLLDKVIVSTDGENVAKIAIRAGADVPFLRPEALAQDSSPTSDVVIHALDFFRENGIEYEMVAVLEPTSPLRKVSDIDKGIAHLRARPDAYALVSVGEVHTEHPLIVKKLEGDFVVPYMTEARKIYQRQQADTAFFPYGVLYLARSDKFRKLRTFYTERTLPMIIERWQNYEVDDNIDFEIVSTLINKFQSEIK
jgi:CMP-N-acetylneuraminic acid synthetase